MKVKELIQELSLEILNIEDDDREVEGGYAGDLLSWVMGRAGSGSAWITIMTNINIVAVAALCDTACVILAENVEIDPSVIDKAKAQDITILRSPSGAFELCAKISSLIN